MPEKRETEGCKRRMRASGEARRKPAAAVPLTAGGGASTYDYTGGDE